MPRTRSLAWSELKIGVVTIVAVVTGIIVWSLKPIARSPADGVTVARVTVELPPGAQLQDLQYPAVAVSSDGTHVVYVLHDIRTPEAYGGLPSNPTIPLLVRIWKGPMKWLGGLAMFGGVLGVALHYLRFGPKEAHPIEEVRKT